MKDILIFIAEDDKDERFFIKEAFSGFVDEKQLRFFANGADLVDHLLQNDGEKPDFIMTDLNMPLMNGLEALTIIKKDDRVKDIPVVVFSTSSYQEDINSCYRQGAKKYICKPASMMDYPKIFQELATELQ